MKENRHLTSFGAMFWKVDFIANLSITVPSSEAFLVACYNRCDILAIDCMVIKFYFTMEFTIACRVEHIHRKPLKVYITMSINSIFLVGFTVNSQNLTVYFCSLAIYNPHAYAFAF